MTPPTPFAKEFVMVSKRIRTTLLGLTCALALSAQAQAQAPWPNKPVRIIVPFAAGSFTDTAARAIAQELSSELGQPFVVESRGGAGSTLGTDIVAKAAPDGYTLLVTDNSFAISAALYDKLPYDPVKDIVKISTVAESPAVLMVRQDLPAKNLKELVDFAIPQPKKLTYGSGGQGSSAHLGMELFYAGAQVEATHVPYKGIAAAFVDLIAGHIDTVVASAGSSAGHIRGGKVRGLAVTGKARHPLLPAVPTFAEAGFPDFNMTYWFGLMAPTGVPAPVLSRLQQGVARAVQQPKVIDAFTAAGARAVASTPAEFAKRVEDETRVWKGVITRAGVKPE